jgi:hypothetical protein
LCRSLVSRRCKKKTSGFVTLTQHLPAVFLPSYSLGAAKAFPAEMISPLQFHFGGRLFFRVIGFTTYLRRAAINSRCSENTLDARPARISASAFARRASIIRRCAGVYSPSALGNLERLTSRLGVKTPADSIASGNWLLARKGRLVLTKSLWFDYDFHIAIAVH